MAYFSIGDWKDISSCYYHHQIGSIHLFHCYHIFSVVVCLRCLLHHILLIIALHSGKICFHYYCAVYDECNNRIRFVLKVVFVCLYITPSHYHHCANLSEDIELIKCLSDIFCPVCIFSQLSIIQYVGLCFQFTHFPCDVRENIFTLFCYHHQNGSMNYYPLFRVRSWNNGVSCMSFCILSSSTTMLLWDCWNCKRIRRILISWSGNQLSDLAQSRNCGIFAKKYPIAQNVYRRHDGSIAVATEKFQIDKSSGSWRQGVKCRMMSCTVCFVL